jgi:hypothetical protein
MPWNFLTSNIFFLCNQNLIDNFIFYIEKSNEFIDDENIKIIISVTATVIGLLLIAMGIGIKFYLDKVRN